MDKTEVRRRPDGSIDIRFYHARAMAIRSQALREAFRPKAIFALMLVAAAALSALAEASGAAQAAGR